MIDSDRYNKLASGLRTFRREIATTNTELWAQITVILDDQKWCGRVGSYVVDQDGKQCCSECGGDHWASDLQEDESCKKPSTTTN